MNDLLTLAGFAGFFYLLADIIDKYWLSDKDHKIKILLPLQNEKWAEVLKSSPESFSFLFDRIFGAKNWCWKRFKRSSIASFVSVLVITIIWWIFRSDQFYVFLEKASFFEAFLGVYIIGIAINLLPDYLSLIETRWIIQKMRYAHSITGVFLLILIDLIVTPMILLGFIAIGLIFFNIVSSIIPESLLFIAKFTPKQIQGIVKRVIEHNFTLRDYYLWFTHFTGNAIPLTTDFSGEPSPGIWFYSTFFTSIWAWFHGFSLLLAKFISKISPVFLHIIDSDKCKNNPIQCLTGQAIIFSFMIL